MFNVVLIYGSNLAIISDRWKCIYGIRIFIIQD